MEEQEFRAQLGKRISELRQEHGYAVQAEFAERIGIDGAALSRIENGLRGVDTLVLQRAAVVLDVSLDEFLAPQRELVMARSGSVEDPAEAEMLAWARSMQHNFDVVEAYGRARA